jgi:transposase
MRRAEEQASGYPSDLAEAQWQVIAPHLPQDVPGRRGRPRVWPLRRIVEAILYVDRAGCAWRYLPCDFPPWRTVYGYFAAWRDDDTLTRLHDALRAQVRAAAGRDGEPTAAIIDSQSVRAADTVPRASRGWDNAKKVNGRKRHIAVDSMGLVLAVVVTAASVQDRDAARPLLWNLHRAHRHIRLIWADAVYTGKLNAWAAAMKMTLQIVARRQPHAFEVLPRRWVVERTFAWISKHRRTVRDYELPRCRGNSYYPEALVIPSWWRLRGEWRSGARWLGIVTGCRGRPGWCRVGCTGLASWRVVRSGQGPVP